MTKAPYITADGLGITTAEHTALVAFATAEPIDGNIIPLNGHRHYYIQRVVADYSAAADHDCGSAGCVAGYVFEHIIRIQRRERPRAALSAQGYIAHAVSENMMLDRLYRFNQYVPFEQARVVVDHMLRTGSVEWRRGEGLSHGQ